MREEQLPQPIPRRHSPRFVQNILHFICHRREKVALDVAYRLGCGVLASDATRVVVADAVLEVM